VIFITKLNEIYRCLICGNEVYIINSGVGQLVCCGKPMELMEDKTTDIGKEKHVPILNQTNNKVIVKVGKIPHPMEEKHYIEWVELMTDKSLYSRFLKPGDDPEASFEISDEKILWARIKCNIHGFWKS